MRSAGCVIKEGRPYLDRIVARFILDSSTRTAALEKGEAHFAAMGAVPFNDAKKLAANPDLTVTTKGHEMFSPVSELLLNTERELLKDKRVRQAIAYAMQRQFIIDNIWFGYGNPATGPMSSNFAPAGLYSGDVKIYESENGVEIANSRRCSPVISISCSGSSSSRPAWWCSSTSWWTSSTCCWIRASRWTSEHLLAALLRQSAGHRRPRVDGTRGARRGRRTAARDPPSIRDRGPAVSHSFGGHPFGGASLRHRFAGTQHLGGARPRGADHAGHRHPGHRRLRRLRDRGGRSRRRLRRVRGRTG